VLFNGQEEVAGGSGVLIGDKFILTNNHVIPPANNYKTQTISIRLKSRFAKPRLVTGIRRDADRDLALLTLGSPASDASRTPCPMPVIKEAGAAPVGTTVYALGFPLNEDFGITEGLISSHTAGSGRWRTDNLITFGNSGGPVFDRNGVLVGLAVAGVGSFVIGGKSRDVDGVNFIVPAIHLMKSPLMTAISDIPEANRCWRDVPDGTTITMAPMLIAGLPQTLAKSYTVSETKDDHPVVFGSHGRNYERRFLAEPGYEITGCTFHANSANHSRDEGCNVVPGGAAAVFRFRLQSGPQVDRWRGWWGGTVKVDQRRRP
jgi:hypothetical protein